MWVRWWLRVVSLVVLAMAISPPALAHAEPPVLAIESPVDGSVSTNPSPSFSGATDDPLDEVGLSIYAGPEAEGAPLQTLSTAPLFETWLVGPVAALPDGIYTAQASQTNLAFEEGVSAPVTFTVDTTPPEVTLTPPSAVTNHAEMSFAGAAGALTGDSSTVKLVLYAGSAPSGTPVETVEATREGNTWSVGPLPALVDGVYTARAEQADEAGNVGVSSPSTFTVDTVAPAPSLTPGVTPSNDATPSLTGAVGVASGDLAAVRLKLYAGASASGSPLRTIDATVVAQEWSVGPLASLSDGVYTARAEQSDEAGNTGFSATFTFTVDTAAPAVSLTPPTSLTSDVTPTFEGKAGVAPGDEAVVQVKVYSGATVSGSPLQTIQATPAAGSWSATPASPLADGVYTVEAIQLDQAGNTGVSGSFKFRIDTTAPAIAVSEPTSGAMTDSSSEPVQGTAGTSEGDLQTITVELFEGSTIGVQEPLETIVVKSVAGHWSTAFGGLAEGDYTVRADQSDSVGNVGMSQPVTFTVDQVAPVVSIAPVDANISDNTPSFSGNAGSAPGDLAAVRLKIYAGASASGSPLRTVDATLLAGEWSAGPVQLLPDGVYTARAEQADEAGNTGFSSTSTFTVDTVAPAVSLTPPASFTSDVTPTFEGKAGVAPGDEAVVQVKVYSGVTVSGSPLQTIQATPAAGSWSATPASPLADGVYTVRANQSDSVGNVGMSQPVTFTVDQVAPVVSISPVDANISDNTPSFSGNAGSAPGDLSEVKLNLYKGATVSGSPFLTVDGTVSDGAWAVGPLSALADGVYTLQAEQSDQAGNTGKSAAMTFKLESPGAPPTEPPPPPTTTSETPPQHAPPTASFTWFPELPHTGEAVSVVSDSSDLYSPIATLAWALAGNPFQPGGDVFTTTFVTPGRHVVRLRVTAADGLSGVVMKVIPVSSLPASLMQPFPVVRIAGANTARGAKLKLITVQAPVGAHITVGCKGRGCPRKAERRVVSSRKGGVVLVEFRRFERLLGAGAVLEIRIWKPGQIGKYTRFQIRRGGLPERSDSCLSPSGIKPMRCPSS